VGERISDIKKGFVSAGGVAWIINFTSPDLWHTWSPRAAETGVPGTSAATS
jgi:hypothetical protein